MGIPERGVHEWSRRYMAALEDDVWRLERILFWPENMPTVCCVELNCALFCLERCNHGQRGTISCGIDLFDQCYYYFVGNEKLKITPF